MRTLSSPDTATAKLVFLPFWTGGWLLGMAALLHAAMTSRSMGVASPSLGTIVFCLVTGSALTAAVWWGFAPLKRVSMDHRELRISNYWREISVLLVDVDDVTQDSWNDLVTVTLRRDTPFGRSIRMMPVKRVMPYLESHPVVDEIRAAARDALDRSSMPTIRPGAWGGDRPPGGGRGPAPTNLSAA